MSRSDPTRKPPRLEDRLKFGLRVRILRKSVGLSQEAFAHKASMDRAYVGGVERGECNVSLDNIHLRSETLGVSVRDLF